jgi:formamidopyrimidine-DNA glycosylase
MPELPEVETTRLGLEPVMRGARISEVTVFRRDLRQTIPDDFEKTCRNQSITALRRRAKYIFIDLENGSSILAHLGMSGTLTIMESKGYTRRTHDHCIIMLDSGMQVVFHDPRRFGLLILVQTAQEEAHKLFSHLGPEPLSNHFHAEYLAEALASRSAALKVALMDQALVVGVGNIYASESLFLARLSPKIPAHKAAKHAATLVTSIREVLGSALVSGGSTLRDYVQSSGGAGYFQHHFRVYDRAGLPCEHCSASIKQITQAARSTYFCPHCQRRS